jgi:hypothetical protein
MNRHHLADLDLLRGQSMRDTLGNEQSQAVFVEML